MIPIPLKTCTSEENYVKSILNSNFYHLLDKKLNYCNSPQLLLQYDCFIKIIALGNICKRPLTTNDMINHDKRVIAKSIKYSIKYKPEETQKYYEFALRSIGELPDGLIKTDYYLLIADAIAKTDSKCALNLALKAFRILNDFKKKDGSDLKLKAIKILANLDPQTAYKVIKLYNDNDQCKISAIYLVYKKCGYKEQKKCLKKMQKHFFNDDFLTTPEKIISLKILDYRNKSNYCWLMETVNLCDMGLNFYSDQVSPINTFVMLGEIFHIYSNLNFVEEAEEIEKTDENPKKNFALEDASKTLSVIDNNFARKMDPEDYIDANILIGKQLKKDQPFLATKYFLEAVKELENIPDPFLQLIKINDIYKHSICFSIEELKNGYKTACGVINTLDSPLHYVISISMILTNKGLRGFAIALPTFKLSLNLSSL